MSARKWEEIIRGWTFGPAWNLALLTVGSALIAFAVKAIAEPFGLLTGGMSGLALLFHYGMGGPTTGQWYFLLNLPVFVLGWVFVSRRFFLYSLYGMLATTLFIDLIQFSLPIRDIWLAVFTGGAVMGAGVGMTLRTLGSTGGSDILAVIFKEKFNLSMGSFEFWFNSLTFLAGFVYLELNLMLYSMAMTFIIAMAIEYVMRLFGERKMVLVVTSHHQEVLRIILKDLDRGATLLLGRGGWSGEEKQVILTMLGSIQLKDLEQRVHAIDPEAFTIIGSGFRVLGRGFSSRKVY